MQSGHYIQANGLEIYYDEVGAGPPLLLLHGGTLTGGFAATIAALLAGIIFPYVLKPSK